MASNDLSKAEQNFTCFTKACIDFIKLPLIDILTDCVKPVDLYVKIKCSSTLMYGKNKLRPDQLKLCFFQLPLLPDYSKFDVTLLYTLIRNLCPSLKPTQGWGLEPNDTDTKIGDDIERLRLLRNNIYAHADSTEISDGDFNNLWNDLQSVIQRIETFTKTWSTTNYKQELTRIKGCGFGYDDRDKYKLLLEATLFTSKSEKIDEPDILITGEDRIVCGDSARFDAEVKRAQLSEWSITWQIKTDDITRKINTSDKKYKGSSQRQLVIQSVCKDDEAEYQAILSNGSKVNINSNFIYLQALGENPVFDVWDIVTDDGAITIEYRYKVSEHSPQVYQEEWTKNREALDRTKFKYLGEQLYSNYFTIKSPTLDDKGTYSCTVTNAVGSASKDVTFDVPFAHISTESKGVFGSMTIFKSEVTSCPKLEGVEWQCSSDGNEFFRIDISTPHYHGSKQLAESPLLVISKTTFEDRLYYRLRVMNKIGRSFSNILYLDVKGSPPNITTSHETNFEKHSVKLIGKVFLYDNCNATTDVFWTKNGNEIDTLNSGGKYSKASTDDSSLTISDVNEHDAGSYQLTATNDVGSTQSDVIVLAIPQVCVKRLENRDGCLVSTALIQSIPAAYHAQWKVKGKDNDTFKPVDVNAKGYKGTSNSLPHPVLIVEQKEEIQKQHFYIQVDNFVGSSKTEISKNAEILTETAFKTEGDNSSNIFNKNGSTIRFNELRRQIIKGLKQSDLQELKDSLEVISAREICGDIASISDFFRYILGKGFLKTRNVIILQYLMRAINRPDLEEICVKYATKDKQALCYYEDPKGQDVPKMYLHVVDDIEHFTSVESLKQTVASIVGCTLDDIKVIGFQPENSFIIIITMRMELLKTLKETHIRNLTKLLKFNIDWIKIEDKVIKIDAGSTPLTVRKVLPSRNSDESLRQVSAVLSNKVKNKGGAAPPPPRRTKMKLRKARIESSGTKVDFYGENDLDQSSVSDFGPTISLQPSKRLELGSPKTFQRMDSKEGMRTSEDGSIGQNSSDSVKRAPIDKSKYMINVDSATKSPSQGDKNATRKFSIPYHRELRLASDVENTRKSDEETNTNFLEENKDFGRYGTIPKSRRIEAYLASMESNVEQQRVDNLPTVEDHDSGTDTASIASCPVLLPESENALFVDQWIQNQNVVPPDSVEGIKLEPYVKPAAVVKPQSHHVIAENQNSHFNSFLQRQKSDLTHTGGALDSFSRQYPDPAQKPKPSPRLSRMYTDPPDQENHHDKSMDQVPPSSMSQSLYKSLPSYSVDKSGDNVFNPKLPSEIKKQSDFNSPNMRPHLAQKMRSASIGDYPYNEEAAEKEDKQSASVLSKVAMFQSAGPDFGQFKPFARGEHDRNSMREGKASNIDDIIGSKPKPPPHSMQQMFMSKSTFDSLEPVHENYPHGGGNSDSDLPVVSRDSILNLSEDVLSSLQNLTSTGNKNSANFMILYEKVLQFHDLCSQFFDSMPPHAKFHAKELLSRLLTQSESVKTICSSNPSMGMKIISDVHASIQEIVDLIRK